MLLKQHSFIFILSFFNVFCDKNGISEKLNETSTFFDDTLSQRKGSKILNEKIKYISDFENEVVQMENKLNIYEEKLGEIQNNMKNLLHRDENVSFFKEIISTSSISLSNGNVSSIEITLNYSIENLSERLDQTLESIQKRMSKSNEVNMRLIFMKSLTIGNAICDNVNVSLVNNVIFEPENMFTLDREEFVNGCINVNSVYADWILTENLGYDYPTGKSLSLSDIKSFHAQRCLNNVSEIFNLTAYGIKFKKGVNGLGAH